MKIRNGFVSNSSSTSFIVPPDRKEEAEGYGLRLIKVTHLKQWLERIKVMNFELGAMYESSIIIGASFLFDNSKPRLNYLEEVKVLPDDYYITEPYDRDRASEEGIDEQFGRFQEDL